MSAAWQLQAAGADPGAAAGPGPAPWGRFTAAGGPGVEQHLTGLVAAIGQAARRVLTPREMVSLVVIGGYGRGEGGVDRASGVERPHNNLDLMVVAPDERTPPAEVKRRLDTALAEHARASGVALDVSVTTLPRLRRSPALVIWYDLRHGHKTVVGDPGLFASMTHFTQDRIPAWDVRNLLTNRGTLLVINEHAQAHSAEPDRRMLVRHVMKAVIGYGDALLYFLGEYDWSYREKQRRMARRTDVPAPFRALYDGAMRFRFEPRYEPWLARDLGTWLDEVRAALEPVHRTCEARRLGVRELDWDGYLPLALAHELSDEAGSARAWARKGVRTVRALAGRRTLGAPGSVAIRHLRAGLGALCANESSLLSLVFPVVAYGPRSPEARRLAQRLLGAPSAEPAALRRAYLHAWAQHGDLNFQPLLARLERAPEVAS